MPRRELVPDAFWRRIQPLLPPPTLSLAKALSGGRHAALRGHAAKVSSHSNNQSFSDRVAMGDHPFDQNQRDVLGITLDANGKITITLDSKWGDEVIVTPTSCANEVIYGFSSDGTLWGFVFYKERIAG